MEAAEDLVPQVAELPPGAVLAGGRFVIERRLGRGGFGITYAAVDWRLKRAVAIKELFPSAVLRIDGEVVPPPHEQQAFDEAKERFLQEATVLARFNHPGIVRVYEVFEEASTAYLVMELLGGTTLWSHLANLEGPMPERHVRRVARACGEALAVIHDEGVLHRDVNPANIMLEGNRVVLIDFGLAREFVAEETAAMTRMATPGYAPPEQYLAQARFGPTTDVYGLAATLYRCAAGVAPASALERAVDEAVVPVHRHNPQISKSLSDAIGDGLEYRESNRPSGVIDFLARMGIELAPPASAIVEERPVTAEVAPADEETLEAQDHHDHAATDLDEGGLSGDPAGIGEGNLAAASGVHGAPTVGAAPAPSWYATPTGHQATGAGFVPAEPSTWWAGPEAAAGAPSGYVAGVDPAGLVPGAWKVDAPLLAIVAGACAAMPFVAVALLVCGALPALATYGDLVVFTDLRRLGDRLLWRHRATVPLYAPVRFVRNVAATATSSMVAAAALALLVVLVLIGAGDEPRSLAADWAVRCTGALAGGALVWRSVTDRLRFRSTVALDRVHRAMLTPGRGRLLPLGWALVIAAVAMLAVGLLLPPQLWPLESSTIR